METKRFKLWCVYFEGGGEKITEMHECDTAEQAARVAGRFSGISSAKFNLYDLHSATPSADIWHTVEHLQFPSVAEQLFAAFKPSDPMRQLANLNKLAEGGQ